MMKRMLLVYQNTKDDMLQPMVKKNVGLGNPSTKL
jgi:hypothetical protein